MMTKSDTIAEIMTINPTVGAAFLAGFSNENLLRYLHRLRSLSDPSGAAIARRGGDVSRSSRFAATTAAAV